VAARGVREPAGLKSVANVRIGRIAGIPVGISPWWLVIVALLTWTLRADYDELAPAAATALALGAVLCLFAGILAHEFGHALVARRAGIEIEEIDLWLLGGVARMRSQPQRAGDELRFALAGPAVTVALAVAFGIAAALLGPGTPRTFVTYQAEVNAALAAFNLLPALPLDGGRVARALLWRRSGDFRRATAIAARAGRWSGYGMVYLGALAALGGFMGGLWLAMIGLFLISAAGAEERMAELEAALAGFTVSDLMSPLTAEPAAELPLVGPELPARRLLELPEFLTQGCAVVADADGRRLGTVSARDLERCLRAPRETAAPSRHGPAGVHR
jgi:Zn-dependent protease